MAYLKVANGISYETFMYIPLDTKLSILSSTVDLKSSELFLLLFTSPSTRFTYIDFLVIFKQS